MGLPAVAYEVRALDVRAIVLASEGQGRDVVEACAHQVRIFQGRIDRVRANAADPAVPFVNLTAIKPFKALAQASGPASVAFVGAGICLACPNPTVLDRLRFAVAGRAAVAPSARIARVELTAAADTLRGGQPAISTDCLAGR